MTVTPAYQCYYLRVSAEHARCTRQTGAPATAGAAPAGAAEAVGVASCDTTFDVSLSVPSASYNAFTFYGLRSPGLYSIFYTGFME